MFRLQNNTPTIYVENSRDFQLLCRLFDYMINGIKYDINSILNILNPMKINDRMLNLLCTKLGFFPKNQYDSRTLRYILSTFPYIIKNKGTKKILSLFLLLTYFFLVYIKYLIDVGSFIVPYKFF